MSLMSAFRLGWDIADDSNLVLSIVLMAYSLIGLFVSIWMKKG